MNRGEVDPRSERNDSDLGALTDPARTRLARRLLAQARGTALDRLAGVAAQLTGAPNAQISLLTDRQVVGGVHGVKLIGEAGREAPLDASLCARAGASGTTYAIDDVTTDPRLAELPEVRGAGLRSYLGVPVVAAGATVGVLAVYGPQPRAWTAQDAQLVAAIAAAAATELELGSVTAEAAQTAQRLDLGFAAANVGSFDWNLVTDELHWDDRLIMLFGYEPASFVAHIESFRARVHPDDLPRTEQAIQTAIANCGEYVASYRIVLPDGAIRWISARGRVLCDGERRPQRMLGAASDTTDVRTGEERISRLLETMSSAFIGLDDQWRFTYVNTEAERLLGRRRDELLGRSVWDEFAAAGGTVFEERFRHAAATGEAVSIEEYYPPRRTWFEVRAWPSDDGLSVFFHDISQRRAAQAERARALERLELLSSAGSRLSATLEVGEIVDLLDDLLLPRLGRWLAIAVGEEVAAVLGERETGRKEELRVVHVGAPDAAERRRLADALLGRRIREAEPGAWAASTRSSVVEALGGHRGTTLLAQTLDSRGRTFGAIVVGDPPPDPADRRLLVDIATRAGVALDNAVLYGAERRAGLALQHFLLPAQLPQLPGIALAARYLPGTAGRAIGGDFYLGHRLGDGRLLLAIGDVMGHGMPAAARMGQLRAVLTAYAYDGEAPGAVLERVAPRADDLLDVRMATVALMIYDPVARHLTAASAGHPPPLLVGSDGTPRFVDLPPGPPIGAGPASYETIGIDVPADTTVVLYTDGLIENRGEPIDVGLGRLRDALQDVRGSPQALCDHVLRALGRAHGGLDDIAILALRHGP